MHDLNAARSWGIVRELAAAGAPSPDTPPDPDQMRELYLRHASRLLP